MRRALFNLHKNLSNIRDAVSKDALNALNRFDTLNDQEKKVEIDANFIKLVSQAYNFVPYYRGVMDKIGLRPEDINGVEMVTEFPVLTKDIIRQQGEQLQAKNFRLSDCFTGRSGGTTGEPITTVLNKRAYFIESHAYWRGLNWMGWKPGEKIVKLFGGSLGRASTKFQSKVKNILINQTFLPAFELKKANAHVYLKALKPEYTLIGYSSAVYELAQLAKEIGYKQQLRNVFVTAEQLPDTWAVEINAVFGCEVKAFYGCGEINSLGFQTAQQGYYKVPADHVKIESVKHKFYANSIAITSLHNFAKPLIRYVNGDIGEINNNDVNPKIIKLDGRSADFFKLKNGGLISGSIAPHSILTSQVPVKKYQFIQIGFEKIEFRYEMDKEELTDDQKRTLVEIYSSHFNSEMNLHFIKTSDFVRSKSGKHRLIVIEI